LEEQLLGKVKGLAIKRFARELVKKYPDKFTRDYEANKKVIDELILTDSKKLRNLIAGYATRLKAIEAERAAAAALPPTSLSEEEMQ
jgi:small subunit ribosomal protein S17e